jgi:hypothetical protein
MPHQDKSASQITSGGNLLDLVAIHHLMEPEGDRTSLATRSCVEENLIVLVDFHEPPSIHINLYFKPIYRVLIRHTFIS